MATDGVKIIDGDLATDTYGTFMEMYDAGASIQEIKTAVEQPLDKEDGFDYEIYITVYALALWQTGQLTPDVRAEVDEAIARGAGAKVWTEECGEKDGKKRQRELEKLREKLALPNPRIRQRRVYKLVTKFVFEENSLLAFQLPDGNYCATILMKIVQHQGRYYYDFITTTYKAPQKPNVNNIINAVVFGRSVAWKNDVQLFGLDIISIGPKALRAFQDKFEVIGKVEIRAEFKLRGMYGYAHDFETFYKAWTDIEQFFQVHRGSKVALQEIIK